MLEDDLLENSIQAYISESQVFINDFLTEFFTDEHEVVKFNTNFIEDNNFEYKTEINFLKFSEFFITAINIIKQHSPRMLDNLLLKYYKDCIFLVDFYHKAFCKKKGIEVIPIIERKFKKSLGLTNKLILKIETKLDEKKKVKFSDKNKIELEQSLSVNFTLALGKKFDYYNLELKKVINTKLYYFN